VSNVETTFKGAFVLATCATPLEVDSVASKQMWTIWTHQARSTGSWKHSAWKEL